MVAKPHGKTGIQHMSEGNDNARTFAVCGGRWSALRGVLPLDSWHTRRNHSWKCPQFDVVIAKPDGSLALSIQVKTSRCAYRRKHYGKEVCEWDVGPSAVNAISDNFWYAFVDLQERDGRSWNPRVFLVPSRWVGKFVKEEWVRKVYMLARKLWPECLGRWDRVNKFFDGDGETLNWCRRVPRGATW